MTPTKQFKTYAEQVALLHQRGMTVTECALAEHALTQLNYYRLSGYWYPMRRFDPETGVGLDQFAQGASFDSVLELYEFDERLRHACFIELDRIEMALRAMLGHELGRIDPLIHLDSQHLGAFARIKRKDGNRVHDVWTQNTS